MECKKCGKKIEDTEMYCSDCKELLKKEKELDKLIEENKELNKLEITKEVETLNNFQDEKTETSFRLKEELKDLVNIEEVEFKLKEENKVLVVVAILTVSILLVLGVIFVLPLFTKEPEVQVDNSLTINYEKIIKDYGESLKLGVSKYLDTNKEVPSWSVINDMTHYSENDVVCSIHEIYEDGNVYLDNCKVNNKRVTYTYGAKQEQVKSGKQLAIYQYLDENNNYIYDVINKEGSELVGIIACKTEECKYIDIYENYVLISENNEQYIYNIETSSMEFGPFNENDSDILSYNNKLYGILYEEENITKIYNISTSKTLKNITGNLLVPSLYFDPSILLKYGYVIMEKDGINNFVNLNSGNVSYTINGTLYTYLEDKNNNLVYMTTINSSNNKLVIYNSNGKKLFNGNEYNEMYLTSEGLTILDDNKFYIYDSKLKLKISSKEYNNVLAVYDKFVIVVDNNYLAITDLNDNIVATSDLEWNNICYVLDKKLSGYSNTNELEIVIEDKVKKVYLEYSYNIVTKEIKNSANN